MHVEPHDTLTYARVWGLNVSDARDGTRTRTGTPNLAGPCGCARHIRAMPYHSERLSRTERTEEREREKERERERKRERLTQNRVQTSGRAEKCPYRGSRSQECWRHPTPEHHPTHATPHHTHHTTHTTPHHTAQTTSHTTPHHATPPKPHHTPHHITHHTTSHTIPHHKPRHITPHHSTPHHTPRHITHHTKNTFERKRQSRAEKAFRGGR